VKYLAAAENQDLGVVKRLRKQTNSPPAQLASALAAA